VAATILTGILLGFGLVSWAADSAPEVDWGRSRVHIVECWPGANAGGDWSKLHAGIRLWRADSSTGSPIGDYEMGWTAREDEGYGVVGLLDGDFELESRFDVIGFGRTGDQIRLVIVMRSTGGVLPETVKEVVKRKMGLANGAVAQVTFADARSAKLGKKKVIFSAPFPDDLPKGKYRVAVELRGPDGKVRQQYDRCLVRGEEGKNPLVVIDDEQLLKEYVHRGEALRGTGVEPIDYPVRRLAAGVHYGSPSCQAWDMTHREVVRRGAKIVPPLIRMLEAEAVRNPGDATFSSAKFGFAIDVMRMLGEIGDARPVPLLVRVMDGMGGKANLPVRQEAMNTAERLTYMTFLLDRDNPISPLAMMGDETMIVSSEWRALDPSPRLTTLAKLFSKWLDKEGRDPKKWLNLARNRARKALQGNDPMAARNAIVFLSPGYVWNEHDDRPAETMRAIARLVERSDQVAVREISRQVPIPCVLASYGPLARPYVKCMIDETARWNNFKSIAEVGGDQAMAFMLQALPRLRQEVKDSGLELDVDEFRMSDMKARRAILAYRDCRWGIERWAGRTFAGDQEIHDWWAKAKSQGQRNWLEENLQRTSLEADAGNAKAQYIIRCVLPDLPNAADDEPFDPPWQRRVARESFREKRPIAHRTQWLRENRLRLEYDEQHSFFLRR
jgi:hypothetical protein